MWVGKVGLSHQLQYVIESPHTLAHSHLALHASRAGLDQHLAHTSLFYNDPSYKHCYLLNNLRKTKLRTLCLDRVLVWRMCRNDLGFYFKWIMYSHGTYNITKQLSTSLYVMSRCHSLHVWKWLLNLQVYLQTLEFELIKFHSCTTQTNSLKYVIWLCCA